jgi:hypothetical protein
MSLRWLRGLYGQETLTRDARSITVTATEVAIDGTSTGRYAEVNGLNLYYETHGADR